MTEKALPHSFRRGAERDAAAAAEERDAVARERDLATQDRDMEAERRDRDADALDGAADAADPALELRAASDRQAAAADRARAAGARSEAAQDREQATLDRQGAADAREQASLDRRGAADDRALAARHLADIERVAQLGSWESYVDGGEMVWTDGLLSETEKLLARTLGGARRACRRPSTRTAGDQGRSRAARAGARQPRRQRQRRDARRGQTHDQDSIRLSSRGCVRGSCGCGRSIHLADGQQHRHGDVPGVCERAFEPFFTTKDLSHGTGLGLATVSGIVEQSGGTVRLESEVGAGTTVTVCLPFTAERPGTTPAQKEGSPRGSGEFVLVAEDEAQVGALSCRILEAHNLAGSVLAQEALNLIPSLRVLYMSGYIGGKHVGHGTSPGGPGRLQKPFGEDSLLRYVAQVLHPTSPADPASAS